MWGHTWLPRDPRPPIFGIALTHGALNPNPHRVFFFPYFGIKNLEIFLFQRQAKLVQFTTKIQIFQHLPDFLCNK
jgi:hypothetical protein